VTLACVGDRDGESARLRYLCRSLGVAERVAFLGHVADDDLPALYQGALAFLYPSLYEGFGLPVVEAMASGVPVITSATSALREVAEGSADLVNPHDVEDIAGAIARCVTSPSHREALVARGRARSADFDWRTTAERTLEVYREAMA
jgi:glycosyltransferase involved in cell wall biosynthesis